MHSLYQKHGADPGDTEQETELTFYINQIYLGHLIEKKNYLLQPCTGM